MTRLLIRDVAVLGIAVVIGIAVTETVVVGIILAVRWVLS